MKNNEDLCEECLVEMFRRVGLKYPNKRFTNQKDWYINKSWTKEEENDFRKWMRKKIAKKVPRVDLEIEMFLLMWGWSCKEEPKRLDDEIEKVQPRWYKNIKK